MLKKGICKKIPQNLLTLQNFINGTWKEETGKKTFQQDMSGKKQQKKYSANFTTNYNLKVCMKNEDIGQM